MTRPRGLCWGCYHTAGVRERYGQQSRYTRRGVPDFYGLGGIPEPTATLPGTPERVAVIEARAAAGQALFHPRDARRA